MSWIQDLPTAVDPRRLHDWIQLIVLDAIIIGTAVFGLHKWLSGPLSRAIADETAAREKADAERDKIAREASNAMQAALGRVEVVERTCLETTRERSRMSADIGEIRQSNADLREEFQGHRIDYERQLGAIRTDMASMEARIIDAMRRTVREELRNFQEER